MLAALALLVTLLAPPAQPPAGFVRAEGTTWTLGGEPVELRGVNLSNWLVIERWMLRVPPEVFRDQVSFEARLTERFGEAEKDRFVERWREVWLSEGDFARMRELGFNVVRVPFTADLLMDEPDGEAFVLEPAGFAWLDRAIELAKAHDMLVILDLHGTPGRQSTEHHTGRSGVNALWTDEAARANTVRLWRAVAERYAHEPAVAAYDLINEPYGDHQTDVRPVLSGLAGELYDAVREVDPDHVIVFPGTAWGDVSFYGDPADRGWENVAFTVHHYPGRYGSPMTLMTFAEFFGATVPALAETVETLGVPMLIGEFNSDFEILGGPALLRLEFDAYAERGFAATVWGHKILNVSSRRETSDFGLTTNVQPLVVPDLRTCSLAEFDAFLDDLAAAEWVLREGLLEAMTGEAATLPIPVADLPPPVGEFAVAEQGRSRLLRVVGGDTWGPAGTFHSPDADGPAMSMMSGIGEARGSAVLVEAFDGEWPDAKVGVMGRAGEVDGAAMAYAYVDPDGDAWVAWRSVEGGEVRNKRLGTLTLPAKVELWQAGRMTVEDQPAEAAVVAVIADSTGRSFRHELDPLPRFDRWPVATVGGRAGRVAAARVLTTMQAGPPARPPVGVAGAGRMHNAAGEGPLVVEVAHGGRWLRLAEGEGVVRWRMPDAQVRVVGEAVQIWPDLADDAPHDGRPRQE